MKKTEEEKPPDLSFTDDNAGNMKKVIDLYKNILVCGIKGVGKITHTVSAVKDSSSVYYIGNTVDHEGKSRPGSYEKYLGYILSLKNDLTVVRDISELLEKKDKIIVIIDEIYGRSEKEFRQLERLFDMKNAQCIQIVGCMKYMRDLIDKIDIIIVLERSGAFSVDKKFGQSICRILSRNAKG